MKKYGSSILWSLILIFVIGGGYIFYSHNQSKQPTPSKTSNVTRRSAPEVILKDLNGHTIKLSDYKGQAVILNFWTSWCPSCREEMPELNKTSKDLAGKNAVLLTVNLTDGTRETPEKAKAYIKDNGFTMPVLLDTEGKAADNYAISSIPATFIINKQGYIYDYIVGPTNETVLMNYINKL